MPNDQIQPDMPLTAFSVPLEMLENVAGTVQSQVVMLPVAGSNLVFVQTGCKQSLGHECFPWLLCNIHYGCNWMT